MTKAQEEKFSILARGVDGGHISMNKAYLLARKSFSNAEGNDEEGFRGNIGEWITFAKDSGWIDKELTEQIKNDTQNNTLKPIEKGNSLKVVGIVVGVIAVVVLVNNLGKEKR